MPVPRTPPAHRAAPLAVTIGFAVALVALTPAPLALTIEFDYAYDSSAFFPPGSPARDALEAAGAFFEAAIGDSLGAIVSGPGTGGSYTAFFGNPSVFQSASALRTESISNFSVAADTLRVFVGAVDLDPFGSGTLAVAGPGAYSIFGTTAYRDAMISRGQGANATASDIINTNGQTANDFATWGGFISFDIDRAWHFGIDTLPIGSQADFLSVALHELTHVLGLGTSDSWRNQVSGTTFLGVFSTAANGGVNAPLQAGGAHWASGLTSVVADQGLSFITNPGATQEVALSPTLRLGTRKLMTELDLAGLADIGWEILPAPVEPPVVVAEPAQVPLPAPALWALAAGLVLVARRLSDSERSS